MVVGRIKELPLGSLWQRRRRRRIDLRRADSFFRVNDTLLFCQVNDGSGGELLVREILISGDGSGDIVGDRFEKRNVN